MFGRKNCTFVVSIGTNDIYFIYLFAYTRIGSNKNQYILSKIKYFLGSQKVNNCKHLDQ